MWLGEGAAAFERGSGHTPAGFGGTCMGSYGMLCPWEGTCLSYGTELGWDEVFPPFLPPSSVLGSN